MATALNPESSWVTALLLCLVLLTGLLPPLLFHLIHSEEEEEGLSSRRIWR
jgi:hypothetical protein